ncbi:hypothetical protein [Spirosoma sp. KNUC1025]|uniref:hypothetical protein n=1 Tax=Spirosoma sp. KNUC1025 TaxID=2894082 RepID=UPI003866B076
MYTPQLNRSAGPCSYNMSRVRSKDTKPELIVRKFLHAHGPGRRFDPLPTPRQKPAR